MEKDILKTCLIVLGILFLFAAILDFAPEILYFIFLYFCPLYLLGKLGEWWNERHPKNVEISNPPQLPNPNPYTLSELQDHLNAYQQKAINSGKRDKWKYGRDYERYIGYLLEKKGWKLIYNGAIEGSGDGGIDLICYKDNKCCLIQCKRWKNNIGEECIERFYDAVERFKIYHSGFNSIEGVFYTTSDYTDEAYDVAWEYDIKCCIKEFDSILEYPPVKCLVRNGKKVYYLPFDKEFDKISVENGCEYKFTVADAEKAGYHYYLNRDVLLKTFSPVMSPKTPKTSGSVVLPKTPKAPKTISKQTVSKSIEQTQNSKQNFQDIIQDIILDISKQKFSESIEQTRTSKTILTPKVSKSVESPKVQSSPMIDYYWNGNKNYPVGYFHAGYFEFIDLKSCRILTTYTDTKIEGTVYILQATFITVSLCELSKHKENFRVFRYFKDFPILPEVYVDNYWESIPEYRDLRYRELIDGEEGYLSYIENQKMYAYTMFKIVHYKIFGEEYNDSCKYGWHYDKGYPEYRS